MENKAPTENRTHRRHKHETALYRPRKRRCCWPTCAPKFSAVVKPSATAEEKNQHDIRRVQTVIVTLPACLLASRKKTSVGFKTACEIHWSFWILRKFFFVLPVNKRMTLFCVAASLDWCHILSISVHNWYQQSQLLSDSIDSSLPNSQILIPGKNLNIHEVIDCVSLHSTQSYIIDHVCLSITYASHIQLLIVEINTAPRPAPPKTAAKKRCFSALQPAWIPITYNRSLQSCLVIWNTGMSPLQLAADVYQQAKVLRANLTHGLLIWGDILCPPFVAALSMD